MVAALCAWGIWSFAAGGVVRAIVDASAGSDNGIDELRRAIESAGVFAPLVYVAAVTIEVVIAPIPGTLLYAPGGALFGGFRGGTLSLAGNVLGAALAAWMAATFGARVLKTDEWPRLRHYGERIARRGVLVVALLRVNPLTSSDVVSYAAGLAGVPVWRVAAGTAIGMAPLCYAQAYAAEWLFTVLPGAGVVVIAMGVAYVAVVAYVLVRGARGRRAGDGRGMK